MRLSLVIIVLFLLSISCSRNNDTTEPANFVLTVTNGAGSGSYPVNREVTITANAPEEMMQFDKWTGDVSTVSDITASPTTLTMPSSNVQVNATYRQLDMGPPVAITVNGAIQHQEMDGFGFFGAMDVWWSANVPDHFYNTGWIDKVITDLGMTMWRNELYPHVPPDQSTTTGQDTYWALQKDVARALKERAALAGTNLKVILTAWTPPGNYKWMVTNFTWAGDPAAVRGPGPSGDYWTERNGGTLNPNKYNEFAQWWINGIKMYKDIGIDVYAISLQNEPMFSQTFNSAVYTRDWYTQVLKEVVPKIKAAYPAVKVFGSENMLEMEGREVNYPHFYHNAIKNDAQALSMLDVFAVHGYVEGVSASTGSLLSHYWANHKNQFADASGKKTWMTETSGYTDVWESGSLPGAFSYAMDIQTAVMFGNVSAWLWWQGSAGSGPDEYKLMAFENHGNKYSVSKNFYRFIRPGAVRIGATDNSDSLSVTAFRHSSKNTLTLVIINESHQQTPLTLNMEGVTANEFEVFVTSKTKKCESAGIKNASSTILLPARSVVTLQAGGAPL
jgi:glucuronoarabinoxylan endo-1,4-beta-xylanase